MWLESRYGGSYKLDACDVERGGQAFLACIEKCDVEDGDDALLIISNLPI